MQLHHRFLVATAIAFSLATGELALRASEVAGAVRIGCGLSSTGAAKSPMELAAALERRIVSGEGVALPDADVPVILDAGAVDISLGSWPDEFFAFTTPVGADLRAARPGSADFQSAMGGAASGRAAPGSADFQPAMGGAASGRASPGSAGFQPANGAARNAAYLSISPVTGNYEFSDSSGTVFWTLEPTSSIVGNWVAPFRRASDAPSSMDPLFDPSRIVLRFFPYDGTAGGAGGSPAEGCGDDASASRDGEGAVATSPRSMGAAAVTNLCISAFELHHTNATIHIAANWPAESPPPENVLDIYSTPRIDSSSWTRIASFSATNPPTSISFPWPELLSSPQHHVHDATCTATTNMLVSPLDGVTIYTNVIWSCSSTLPRPSPTAAFFRLGTRLDTDGDGLPDALETLTLGTNPNSPDFGDPAQWPASLAQGLSGTPVSPALAINDSLPVGAEILSRTFTINRQGAWRQYFVAASTNVLDCGNLPLWDCDGARLEWSDNLGGGGLLAANAFSGALRIPVSTNATTLTLKFLSTESSAMNGGTNGGGGHAASPLFLLEYEPTPSFPGIDATGGVGPGGEALVAILQSDEIVVRADRSSRPITPGRPLTEDETLAVPFELPGGAGVAAASNYIDRVVITNLPCGAYPWQAPIAQNSMLRAATQSVGAARRAARPGSADFQSATRPGSAGFQPADTARPEAAPPATGTLFVLSPSLAPFCGHHCGETIYLSADGFPVDHSYPFEETCLRKAFLRDDTGAPHCGGTVSLGLRGDAQSALDTGSFSGGTAFNGAITTSVEVSDEHITGRVHVGGALFWQESVPHSTAWPQNVIRLDKILSSEGGCDEECGSADCASGECDGYDGPSLGSLRFRISLGEPRANQHSAFLYLDEAEIPASVAPSAFRLRRRPDATMTDTTDAETGVRTVVCADPHGRTLQIAPIDGGSEIAVSLTATGEAVCTWRVERTAPNAIRFRRFALNGDAMTDETITLAANGDWERADAIGGLVETLYLPDPWQDDAKSERRVLRDAAGNVLTDAWTDFSRIDTTTGPATRETMRTLAHGTGSWSDSFAEYWANSGLPGRDGLPALARFADGRTVITDYDVDGRTVLRMTSRSADWLYSRDVSQCADPLDALAQSDNAMVETFDYTPPPSDTAAAQDAKTPRRVSRYLKEPDCPPVLVSREWTTITRDLAALHGAAVRVRTERAAFPDAVPGAPSNAVSSVLRYDEAAPGVPLPLRGAPILETDEDGVETRHEHDFGAWDTATLAFTPVPSGASGAFLRTRTLRAPAAAPSGVPGVTTVAETIRDAALGTEVFSCTRAVLPGGEFSEPFEWRATARDDRNRVTCVRYYDGTYSSNEWSCCRLLATTDRTGARTLRSSSPALTRVYHAEEAASMAALPHSEKFIPYESPYSNEEAAIGVTQRWFDSLGRETNTVRRTDLTPGASADPARTRSRGIGWFATNSVAYPAGESRLSVETDAHGVRTRRASHIDAETGVTATFADTYAPGVLTDSIVEQYLETEESIPDIAAAHSVCTESHIDGTTVTRESWDGGASWIETTSDTLFAPDGARTERTTVMSSDGASDGVSLRCHDLLGRLVEIDAPGDHRVFSYAPGSMRVAGESNLLSGVASERIYDSIGAEIGSTAQGVTAETRVSYALDASNALWRVTRAVEFSDAPVAITNRWTEMREQLTRLPASVLSRVEIASSVGETSSTVLERESETSPLRRETTISNVSGTRVRRIQFGRVIEETTSGGTTYHYFDAFGRSFTTDHSDPGETAKKHRTWTGRNRFGDVGEEDEFWRGGTTDAAVHATFFGFDHFGHLSSSTNAVGGASEFSHDFRGNRTSESGATYPALQAYDSAGRRIGLSTTRGGTAWDATVWSYAAATGLCTNKTYADGSAVSYTHTPDGLPLRTTRPSGHWTEYSYNSRRDRVATLSDDPPVAAAFQFDVFGRETAFSNSVATSLLSRNSRGNVTNEATSVGGESFALVRGFDEAGRMSSVNGTHYSYAEDGLLAGVSNAAAVVTYEYAPDRADAGYEITLTNGTTITRRVQREAYRRALATNITTSVNGATVETLAYSFDALGRPVSRNADSFGYNTRGEVDYSFMAAENAEDAYSYDHIGNLALHESPAATNAYTANNLNQYTSIQRTSASSALSAGETSLTYDLDGNLVSDGVFAYAYDSANRLTSVSSNGISVATFAYDAKSRRVRKTTPSATHTYFYDDWNLVKETVQRSNGSTVQRTYVWGKDLSGTLQGAGGVGGLLAVIHDNIPYFPCYDNNGNVTRYLDASGATVAAYTYGAFGQTVTATGPLADAFPHRFSTKYFDPETGLYYYGYRYYSPSLMRWLNRDPIEEKGGLNLYAFCDNNAVLKLDAIGLKCMIESGPKLLPNEVWHLVHLSFESDRHDGVLLLRGIEAIWRRKGIVYCCCRGKSTKKTVYRIHNAKFTFDPVANGGPPLGLSPEISGPLSVPIPLSGTRALGELLGAIAFDITGPPAMFDDENFQRLKDGIRRTRPNDNSGNWPDDPCN